MNTAARLEGANKYLGTSNCVSESVTTSAGDYLLRCSGDVCLKGKTEFVRVYEALDDTEISRELVKSYAQAYDLMSTHDVGAKAAFETLARQYPDDRLIGFHLGR